MLASPFGNLFHSIKKGILDQFFAQLLSDSHVVVCLDENLNVFPCIAATSFVNSYHIYLVYRK